MRGFLFIAFIAALILRPEVGMSEGTYCIEGKDWDDVICEFAKHSDRCDFKNFAFAGSYANCGQGDDCPPVVKNRGKMCKGVLKRGQWYLFQYNNKDWRCPCGCFAEETEFSTAWGSLSGKTYVARSKNAMPVPKILSSFSVDTADRSFSGIAEITSGKERKPVIKVFTADSREILFTENHPIFVGSSDLSGRRWLKKASNLKKDDMLITEDNKLVEIAGVERVNYEGNVVNFKVKSSSHVIYPNGIMAGDLYLQNQISKNDKRVLDTIDIMNQLAQIEKTIAEDN